MILCHQHAGQLTEVIREALEANSANFSAFRLSPRDAVTAAIRLDDADMQTMLPRLNAYFAVTSICVDGKQTAPFTLETIRPKTNKKGDEIAKTIEKNSVEKLVDPHREMAALTAEEIQEILDDSDIRKQYMKPNWIAAWNRKIKNYPKAV